MKREALEQLIARLDSQPAGLASQTSSALLAAGADVEPLLQMRLQQTDRCRGLALVAGILASRNAAEADVEAAFTRVLEGKCDGREPFDLQLAQSVAAAFMTRPEGIAKMARLLVHRDVSVRRRAAEAFGTLYERLGSGEHAQSAAAVDPALLPAVRAALEPLVAFATTERDQQAPLPCRAGAHARATGGARCAASRRRGGDRRPHAPLPGVAESLTGLAARSERAAAFDGRCIPALGVARRLTRTARTQSGAVEPKPRGNAALHIPDVRPPRALIAGRLARLGASRPFHSELLGPDILAR